MTGRTNSRDVTPADALGEAWELLDILPRSACRAGRWPLAATAICSRPIPLCEAETFIGTPRSSRR